MAPLAKLLHSQGVDFHIYADDICVYESFDAAELATAAPTTFSSHMDAVSFWVKQSALKFNSEKTPSLCLAAVQP